MVEKSKDNVSSELTRDNLPPIKRQAVVVVHGQGEQRPMGTIRDFAQTLWTFDFGLRLKDKNLHDEEKGNRSWIVPDDKGGLFDIQRITCPALADGRRTDFFELYYADILSTTPLRTLWRWLRRLLWIDPRDVTARMRWPWTVFWFLAFGALALAWLVAFSAREIFEFDWKGVIYDPLVRPGVYVAGFAVGLLALPRLSPLFGFLAAIPVWLVGLVGFVGVGFVFGSYWAFWSASGLALEIFLALRFLLPYFGDAASYLSAHTETVESRQLVRSRGLDLLKALHEDPEYDRIVLIGHSLGSVLAYDLLHILWGQVGPLKSNPPEAAAAEALEAIDVFVASRDGKVWTDEDVNSYQALQWKALNLIRCQKADPENAEAAQNGWKISDFVTLGSPLTSAQFIMADGKDDFERLKMERVMPTAPAQKYNEGLQACYRSASGQLVAHHGAVFSTVRWTNIYDPFHPVLFVLGDPVAGPVSGAELFGNGILEACQEIYKGGPGTRVFTHNHYWTNTTRDWRSPSPHICALRDAVEIDRLVPNNKVELADGGQ